MHMGSAKTKSFVFYHFAMNLSLSFLTVFRFLIVSMGILLLKMYSYFPSSISLGLITGHENTIFLVYRGVLNTLNTTLDPGDLESFHRTYMFDMQTQV